MSGAVVERLIEAMKMALKISRSLNGIDNGMESSPASIALLKRMQETQILQEAYLERFKDRVRWLSRNSCRKRSKNST